MAEALTATGAAFFAVLAVLLFVWNVAAYVLLLKVAGGYLRFEAWRASMDAAIEEEQRERDEDDNDEDNGGGDPEPEQPRRPRREPAPAPEQPTQQATRARAFRGSHTH